MSSSTEAWQTSNPTCRLVIWHTEGTAISGLLSWMWRLKKSLPAAGIELTLVSLEIQPFRFPQICEPEAIYDVRIRTPQEFIAFLKKKQSAVHVINHAYEYVDLLAQLSSCLLDRLALVGICHTDQDYYYQNIERLDSHLSGIIAVSSRCAEKLADLLPHRRGSIPILPDWDMPVGAKPAVRISNERLPLRVLFNGRLLHLQKRVLDLPEISRWLASAGANVHLTIIGDGPDLPKLREEFMRGSHVSHSLLAPRAPWGMDKILNEHDIFLQVSEFEGASVSLMEAMISGLVPVVTNTESGTDLLLDGYNAVVCPVGDFAFIAARLLELERDRKRIPELSREALDSARTYLKDLEYGPRLRNFLNEVASVPVVPAA